MSMNMDQTFPANDDISPCDLSFQLSLVKLMRPGAAPPALIGELEHLIASGRNSALTPA